MNGVLKSPQELVRPRWFSVAPFRGGERFWHKPRWRQRRAHGFAGLVDAPLGEEIENDVPIRSASQQQLTVRPGRPTIRVLNESEKASEEELVICAHRFSARP